MQAQPDLLQQPPLSGDQQAGGGSGNQGTERGAALPPDVSANASSASAAASGTTGTAGMGGMEPDVHPQQPHAQVQENVCLN